MQHTLIPFKDRKKLHREYILRVVTVTFFVLAATVVIGMAALFPAFIRGWIYDNEAQNAVKVAGGSSAGQNMTEIKSRLSSDGKLLTALVAGRGSLNFSEIIRSLINVRGPVVISSIKIDRPDEKTITTQIKGTAPTRDELLAFSSRLEALMPGTKVEIPIKELAKSINPSFDLSFSRKLP